MTLGRPACVDVYVTAENPKSETFNNVDVFGRVFDANGANALDRDDASDAGRLSNIKEVPPGKSRQAFRIIVSEQALQEGDLKFVAFKAKAYPGSGYKGLSPLLDDCEFEDECEQVPF